MEPAQRPNRERIEANALRLLGHGIQRIPTELPKISVHRTVTISRRNRDYQRHYYDIKVKGFDNLKKLVGVPDRLLETNGGADKVLFPMDSREVPDIIPDRVENLSRREFFAVQKAAQNMVFGHSHSLKLNSKQHAALLAWIEKHGSIVPVFQAPDLEVLNGQIVRFEDAAIVRFHTVTVHGSGSIDVGPTTRFIADEIRTVA